MPVSWKCAGDPVCARHYSLATASRAHHMVCANAQAKELPKWTSNERWNTVEQLMVFQHDPSIGNVKVTRQTTQEYARKHQTLNA